MFLRNYILSWRSVRKEVDGSKWGRSETKKYENGDVYQGQTIGKFREGYGIYVFSFGDKYEGEYMNDMKNGYGIYTFGNGDMYVGRFRNNLKHGLGKFIIKKNGRSIQGRWKNDKLEIRMNDKVFSYAKEMEVENTRNLVYSDHESSSESEEEEREYDDFELEEYTERR